MHYACYSFMIYFFSPIVNSFFCPIGCPFLFFFMNFPVFQTFFIHTLFIITSVLL